MTGKGGQSKDAQQTVGSLFKSSELEITVAIGRHMNTIVSVAQLALVVIMLWGLCKGLLLQGARVEDEPFRDAVFWFGMLLVVSHIVELTRMPDFYWVMRDCDKTKLHTLKRMENFKVFTAFQALLTSMFLSFVVIPMGPPIWLRVPFFVFLFILVMFVAFFASHIEELAKEILVLERII